MTPVNSERNHDPDRGSFGDCHSACLASLLDLPLSQVPLFFDGRSASECWAHVNEWLEDFDLTTVDVIYPGRFTLDEVLLSQAS